jgi:hypothetical protein
MDEKRTFKARPTTKKVDVAGLKRILFKVIISHIPLVAMMTLFVISNCLFDCSFVYSCTSNFSALWRQSSLPVIGLSI